MPKISKEEKQRLKNEKEILWKMAVEKYYQNIHKNIF